MWRFVYDLLFLLIVEEGEEGLFIVWGENYVFILDFCFYIIGGV